MSEFTGKKIAILGFGSEGQAVLKFLEALGYSPVIFDEREAENFTEEEQALLASRSTELGKGAFEKLTGFDIAFRSPGVHRLHRQLLGAEQAGLRITSQTKWFFENCPARIIGVTGTKGKGTTATLIYEMLKPSAAGSVYLTGNIGTVAPLEIVSGLGAQDTVIFELSSFQLQDLQQSPHVGVVLMVTKEHLDHHQSVEEYHKAKQTIVQFQSPNDFAIVNADYEASKLIGAQGLGQKLYFSRKAEVERGAFVRGGSIVVKLDSEQEFDASKRMLLGAHNLENIAAATLAALISGANPADIQNTIRTFRGLEHRLEFVGEFGGVLFYNDSFATTPESTLAAVMSFSSPVLLILGGSEKHSDFTELAQTIARAKHIKHIALIGQTGPRIREALVRAGYDSGFSEGANSMKEIFKQLKTHAQAGDTVLLSPACASFGEFRNYKDRGQQFKEAARLW